VDILLVNPPRVTKSGNIWHGINSTWPPLGLLYIAAYAESRGWNVRVMDATAEKLGFGQIEEFVREHRPPFVGVTSVTAQIGGAHRIAELVKRASPGSRVVLGGVHPTALPEEVLQDRHVDYVIRGEGEKAFANLVEGRPPELIEGLCYRSAQGCGTLRRRGRGVQLALLPGEEFRAACSGRPLSRTNRLRDAGRCETAQLETALAPER